MREPTNIAKMRENNAVLHHMKGLTKHEPFNVWFALWLCKARTIAQSAYNGADMHDAIWAARLQGRLEAYQDVVNGFENIEDTVKASDVALAEALRKESDQSSDWRRKATPTKGVV